MKPRGVLVAVLALSGLGDVAGGLLSALDWRRAATLMARAIPDWREQERAMRMAFADDALHQLWANLGTALLALGLTQLVAAYWVARGRTAGYDLARLVGWALLLAGAIMALGAGQLSSLATEAARGLVLLGLATWARTALEAEAPSTSGAGT
ncbi:MAG: hypothetical protein ABI960_07835 [Candidatus Eisenbacteria bacterium]